jgi:replication-associated recombination protein RarA
MKIINTGDPTIKPSVVMMIYGEGGVGKTTFASTAPSPIIADSCKMELSISD